jgi:hypothetical protein
VTKRVGLDDFNSVPSLPDEPDNRTSAVKRASLSQNDVRTAQVDAIRTVPALALDQDILGRFRADLHRLGVAGEEKLGTLTYLAVTSRVLPWGKPTERPVSQIAKGTTSTGKSHTAKSVLRFFPENAYINLGSMSRRFLFYSDESFEHRFLYVPEWASVKDDDELVALLRVLLSEGRIVHGTVDIDRTARVIQKDGPTGLLMTTTDAAVDLELETRCLTIITDDSTEQTRRVYGVLADLEENVTDLLDFNAWHELQEWIAIRDNRVLVPYVRALAELMPVSAPRLRRDFGSVLSLIRAHALLYQAQRETDSSGRIVATVEGDYEAVRELVSDLIAEGVEASVSPTIRETVAAVQELLGDDASSHVGVARIADRLAVGRSATYDRVRRAVLAGFLINVANEHERGLRIALGAELPASGEDFLPSPEEVVRFMSGAAPGLASGITMPDPRESSGRPGRPADMEAMVECVVCDALFVPGANGSGPVSCPACVARRRAQ